ncbi:hypothetical protein [Streptomyces sp. NPDC088801]|uniref:hypothetical protein n=1 Tax=Streptomyces sp. NPDC088801 TaxID=3365903 RepID=UPI0038208C8A
MVRGIAAFLLLFVMTGLCVSLVKALRAEPTGVPERVSDQERAAGADDRIAGEPAPGPGVVPAGTLADPRPAS